MNKTVKSIFASILESRGVCPFCAEKYKAALELLNELFESLQPIVQDINRNYDTHSVSLAKHPLELVIKFYKGDKFSITCPENESEQFFFCSKNNGEKECVDHLLDYDFDNHKWIGKDNIDAKVVLLEKVAELAL